MLNSHAAKKHFRSEIYAENRLVLNHTCLFHFCWYATSLTINYFSQRIFYQITEMMPLSPFFQHKIATKTPR